MENAFPLVKDDAFAGGVPAESSSSSSGNAVLLTEEESAQGASGVSSHATGPDVPHTTRSPVVTSVSVENASSKSGTSSYSFSTASLWQTFACSQRCWFSPSSRSVNHRLRIACGVCLLLVAALLLCIAVAAGLSVYGGYDFTEGVVGHFMSHNITPLVLYVTYSPLFANITNSIKFAAALGVMLMTVTLTVGFPLWHHSAVVQVGWLTSFLHDARACCYRCLHSLLLRFLPRTSRWCCCRGSHTRGISEGERESYNSRRRNVIGGSSTTGGAVCRTPLSCGTTERWFDKDEALLRVDKDTGKCINTTTGDNGAFTAGKNSFTDDASDDRMSVRPATQRRSGRSSLRTVRWWSAPFTRLKEVIRHLLIIVTAKLRGPDAAEALAGTDSAVKAETATTTTTTTVGAGAAATTYGSEFPTQRSESAGGSEAATARGRGVRPAPATGRTGVTAGTVQTAAELSTAELVAGGATEASSTHATSAHTFEKRRDGGADQDKSRASPSISRKGGRVSTDAEPFTGQRTSDKLRSSPTRDVNADDAVPAAERNTIQPVMQQQGRDVSGAERMKKDTVDVFQSEEQKAKNSPFSFVESMRARGRSRQAAAAAAGKTGDSESSAGSLVAESEPEEWLMLQETDGKRQ